MAREINRHFPCNPGSSKHFFEIFPNVIYESSPNFYYFDKSRLLRKRNSLTLTFANKSYFNINKFYHYKNYGERNIFIFSYFSFNEILLI